MNKKAYIALIEQDLTYLVDHSVGRSQELDHIRGVLSASIGWYYPDKPDKDPKERAMSAYRQSCEYAAADNGCIFDGCCECRMDAEPCMNFIKAYDNEAS